MGHIVHKAVLITSWNPEATADIAAKARALGLPVVGPSDVAVNGFRTLLIPPCGSKIGWPDEVAHEGRLASLRAYLHHLEASDVHYPEWSEVHYGHDLELATVADHPYREDPIPCDDY